MYSAPVLSQFYSDVSSNHTLATCRGFWCSIPPCSRKPHGAPPDRVMITSSATILRSVLASMVQFVGLGGPQFERSMLLKGPLREDNYYCNYVLLVAHLS